MFAEYAKHRESMGNARIATLMIDKYLQRFREQLDILSNISNNKQEIEMGNLDKDEIKQDQGHFVMPVTDVLYVSGRGYVLAGVIESGTVHIGDTVVLNNGKKSLIAAIDINRELVDWATKGESINLFVGSLKKSDLDNVSEQLIVEVVENPNTDFEMAVSEHQSVKGRGVVVKGEIKSGSISIGEPVIVCADDQGLFKSSCVDAIEIDGKPVETVKAGQTASLSFKGLTARNKVDETITSKMKTE